MGGDAVGGAAAADGGEITFGGDDVAMAGDREPHDEGGDATEDPPVDETDTDRPFILSIPVFLSRFCFWKSCSSSRLPNTPVISCGRPIVVLAAVISDLSSSRSRFNLALLFWNHVIT